MDPYFPLAARAEYRRNVCTSSSVRSFDCRQEQTQLKLLQHSRGIELSCLALRLPDSSDGHRSTKLIQALSVQSAAFYNAPQVASFATMIVGCCGFRLPWQSAYSGKTNSSRQLKQILQRQFAAVNKDKEWLLRIIGRLPPRHFPDRFAIQRRLQSITGHRRK